MGEEPSAAVSCSAAEAAATKRNERLRRRLRGLQATRQALEGLGGQLGEGRANRGRIDELEQANAVLERRAASLLLEKHRESQRVEGIARGLEQLRAAVDVQQERLFEAQAELARLQGIEAEAIASEQKLAAARAEHEELSKSMEVQDAELAACSEHAEAFLTTLVRLAGRSRGAGIGAGVSGQALLDTFFPADRPLSTAGGPVEGLEASLRGIVGEVSRLLAAQAAAHQAHDAELEEARGAARASEERIVELEGEVGARDQVLAQVLGGLGALAGENQDVLSEEAAMARAEDASAPAALVRVRAAVAACLSAVAERVQSLEEHHSQAANESRRREAELHRLSQDFEGLISSHRDTTAALARREQEGEGLEAVVRRQREEAEATSRRLDEAERTALDLEGRLAEALKEKAALEEQKRQRQEELRGWQRYAQRCQQDAHRSLQQGMSAAGGGPVLVSAAAGGRQWHQPSPPLPIRHYTFRASSRF